MQNTIREVKVNHTPNSQAKRFLTFAGISIWAHMENGDRVWIKTIRELDAKHIAEKLEMMAWYFRPRLEGVQIEYDEYAPGFLKARRASLPEGIMGKGTSYKAIRKRWNQRRVKKKKADCVPVAIA